MNPPLDSGAAAVLTRRLMKAFSPRFARLAAFAALSTFAASAFAVEAPAAPKIAPKAAPAAPTKKAAAPQPKGDPSVAAPKQGNARFFELHESFLKRGKEGPVGLLFLGDSITEGWGRAKDVWEKYYGSYQPANFGIGGDRVEHVLWRIENGELEGLQPKVTVIMIGTNNTSTNTAPEIAAGVRKLVGEVRAKLPKTKVLLLAVFPRGPRTADENVKKDAEKKMAIINDINQDIAKLDDGQNVKFLDIGPKFLVNGAIPMDVMPDQLHPNAKGYQIWADAMQPTLEQMLK
jgi:lysophospholipase L1-like esterase